MLAESVSKAATGDVIGLDDDKFEQVIKGVNDDEDEEQESRRVYRRVSPPTGFIAITKGQRADDPLRAVENTDPPPRSLDYSVKPILPTRSMGPKRPSTYTCKSFGTINTSPKLGRP